MGIIELADVIKIKLKNLVKKNFHSKPCTHTQSLLRVLAGEVVFWPAAHILHSCAPKFG